MDTFLPYLLPLLLVPLSLYLIFFIRKNGSDDHKNLPPGSTGWPLLGENAELGRLAYPKFVKDRMQKYSPDVFRTSFLGEKIMVFCGAQGNKLLFKNGNKLVTPWLPPSFHKVLFPDYDENSSYADPKAAFNNFIHDALKPEALKQYMPVMDSFAREQLDRGWRPNTVVKVSPLINKFTFELSIRLFLNEVDPHDGVSLLSDTFARMSDGLLSMPIDFPGTALNRAVKAGKVLRGEMMRIVKERRKEVAEKEEGEGRGRGLLSKVLSFIDEDGRYLSDGKIASFFVSTLLASYETAAYALTAVIYFLAQLPHIYEQVFKEQVEIAKSKGPDEQLTWEDVEKMKYSRNVVNESLRLAPPAPGGFREANAEFNFAGFTIPKGWKTFWTVHSSHKNPDYFPEPEKFDPSRFEGSGPAPYTFVPFGGGANLCPGRDYAKLAILVFMHNLVTRFRLEMVIPNEKMVVHIRPTPAHGLPLHLHPHQQ